MLSANIKSINGAGSIILAQHIAFKFISVDHLLPVGMKVLQYPVWTWILTRHMIIAIVAAKPFNILPNVLIRIRAQIGVCF